MKHRLRYAYYDLGERNEGDRVVVSLEGSAANVLLLDQRNFARYRGGMNFSYVGGLRRRSPVRLSVPYDSHWYVTLDHGGRRGQTQGSVRVVPADKESDSERVSPAVA